MDGTIEEFHNDANSKQSLSVQSSMPEITELGESEALEMIEIRENKNANIDNKNARTAAKIITMTQAEESNCTMLSGETKEDLEISKNTYLGNLENLGN